MGGGKKGFAKQRRVRDLKLARYDRGRAKTNTATVDRGGREVSQTDLFPCRRTELPKASPPPHLKGHGAWLGTIPTRGAMKASEE